MQFIADEIKASATMPSSRHERKNNHYNFAQLVFMPFTLHNLKHF
jgi:hypothetical protein